MEATSRRVGRVAGEALGWWAVASGLWLVTLSSAPVGELIVAVAASLPCAAIAVAGRAVSGISWSPRSVPLRWIPVFATSIVSDAVSALALLLRRALRRRAPAGKLIRAHAGRGSADQPRTRRATAGLLLSLSPGTFMVEGDARTGVLTIHRLVGSRDLDAMLRP